jgi:hypothetical protein
MHKVLGALAALAALHLVPTAGLALGATVNCGDTVTQDTTLDNDLVCSGSGLTVTGEDITLDLPGHSITGAGSGGFMTGIKLVNASAKVVNGTVQGFGIGVNAARSNPSEILNVRAAWDGIGFTSSSSIVIKRSEAVYNTFNGFGFGHVPIVVLERNIASHNGGDGILIEGSEGLLTKNTTDRNAGLGIFNQGATDGGKNKARKNGDQRQCVGVGCRP